MPPVGGLLYFQSTRAMSAFHSQADIERREGHVRSGSEVGETRDLPRQARSPAFDRGAFTAFPTRHACTMVGWYVVEQIAPPQPNKGARGQRVSRLFCALVRLPQSVLFNAWAGNFRSSIQIQIERPPRGGLSRQVLRRKLSECSCGSRLGAPTA